jgi:hypothetical protein
LRAGSSHWLWRLIIAALGNPRIAKIKHQSQTGEVLSDVGQNESKIKEIIFQRVLTKSAAS